LKQLVAAVALISIGLTSCAGRPLGRDEARLVVSGRADVAHGSAPWRRSGGGLLHSGDRVRVRRGTAQLQLSGERALELRDASVVRVGPSPDLLSGDVLMKAPKVPLTVSAAGSQARVTAGAARLDAAPAMVAGVYEGTLGIDSAGRTLVVPALRQAAVPAPGLVPEAPAPLQYDASVPWDRRYLGSAMELGSELDARSRGLSGQFSGGAGQTPGFYSQLLPGLAKVGFAAELLQPTRTPGETLVGAAIAEQSTRGSFADRWGAVFGFRDQGAAWGLVALDQDVGRSSLLGELDGALGRAPVPIAAPAVGQPNAPPQTRAIGATTTGAGPTPTTGGSSPTTNHTTPTTTGPSGTTTTTLPGVTLPTLPQLNRSSGDQGLADTLGGALNGK